MLGDERIQRTRGKCIAPSRDGSRGMARPAIHNFEQPDAELGDVAFRTESSALFTTVHAVRQRRDVNVTNLVADAGTAVLLV